MGRDQSAQARGSWQHPSITIPPGPREGGVIGPRLRTVRDQEGSAFRSFRALAVELKGGTEFSSLSLFSEQSREGYTHMFSIVWGRV